MNTPKHMAYARTRIGQHEAIGEKENPYIASCFRLVNMHNAHDSIDPWCGAFMADCMHSSGYDFPKNAASARSWLNYGKPLDKPEFGCITIYSRPTMTSEGMIYDDGIHAHVNFYLFELEPPNSLIEICGLGGNQQNTVGLNFYFRSRVLGYRWPA
jgi:uncharacterized protein (TIGR02594 family)